MLVFFFFLSLYKLTFSLTLCTSCALIASSRSFVSSYFPFCIASPCNWKGGTAVMKGKRKTENEKEKVRIWDLFFFFFSLIPKDEQREAAKTMVKAQICPDTRTHSMHVAFRELESFVCMCVCVCVYVFCAQSRLLCFSFHFTSKDTSFFFSISKKE